MNLALSKDAQKQYKRLPRPEQEKVRKKLLLVQEDPYAGKKLGGEFNDFYSFRAWPYRILYEINKSEKRIEVHKISHRQGSYK